MRNGCVDHKVCLTLQSIKVMLSKQQDKPITLIFPYLFIEETPLHMTQEGRGVYFCPWQASLIVFLSSGAIMVLELVAGRLMAPVLIRIQPTRLRLSDRGWVLYGEHNRWAAGIFRTSLRLDVRASFQACLHRAYQGRCRQCGPAAVRYRGRTASSAGDDASTSGEGYLRQGTAVILTDDYVPVDNLLAPVFADSGL